MSRIAIPDTAFRTTRQRRPKVLKPDYLEFVRSLPCLICGTTYDIHAAHIRMRSHLHGKQETGAGRKPDDRWATPLCSDHHVFGPDAQHASGEAVWWEKQGIDPIVISALLYSHFSAGDHEGGVLVCHHARAISGI